MSKRLTQPEPIRTGRSTVRLRVTIPKDAQGAGFEADTASFDRTMEIHIRSAGTEIRRFWRDNWKWVLPGGGLGTAAALYGLDVTTVFWRRPA